MAARRDQRATNEPVTTGAAGITQTARYPSPRREVGPAEVIVLTVSEPGTAATLARWGERLAALGRENLTGAMPTARTSTAGAAARRVGEPQ